MKKLIIFSTMLLLFVATVTCSTVAPSQNHKGGAEPQINVVNITDAEAHKVTDTKIQVAILLDTSSSMDGLIDQAKARLWNIVNTLTTLRYHGEAPMIEIALYEYGNSGIRNDNYIRQKTPFTTDLDLVSEQLFALKTNGGLEYCGSVIDEAVKTLRWGKNRADMKLIYIAGNESFAQGRVSYKKAISDALVKNIYVNTIHCGYAETGIRDLWYDAAERAKGKYFNINQNAALRHIDTPYDRRISECNTRLNSTYVAYGSVGDAYFMRQSEQDVNAKSMSASVYADRAVSKSKSTYSNSEWDMVDKASSDTKFIANMRTEDLPKELQGKSTKEIEASIAQKAKERTAIQSEINELAKQRQEYIDKEMKKTGPDADDLGNAINSSILALAKTQGYTVAR